MSEPTFDKRGQLHLGPYGAPRPGRLTVDFGPEESDGIAISVKAFDKDASDRAVIELGDYLIGQDPSGNGTADFGIVDADGNIVIPGSYLWYLDAVATATQYHMQKDAGLAALVDVATGTPVQAEINALANALKAAFAVHAASVGTRTARGFHLAADAGNAATLAAVANASNLATSITLINALLAAINAHNGQGGVHFHDDVTVVSITTDPPVTIADAAQDINDLRAAWVTHFTTGVAD